MGCAQSRVDNEEAVARCKERRNVIKEAVAASKAFAAGHFAYAIALKNTGAALSDYGHGESDQIALDDVLDQQHYEKQSRNNVDPAAPQPPPPPPIENLPPPPPPLPKFSPSPIKRAISLPTMAVRGRKVQTLDAMVIEEEEEDEEEEEEEEGKDNARATARKVEDEEEALPRTPENVGNNGRKRLETTPEIVSASPGNSMAWDYFFMVENMPGPNLDDREMRNGYENQSNHFQFNEEDEEEEEERSGIFRKNSGSHKVVEEMEPKTPEKAEEVEEEEEEEEEDEEEEEEEEVVVEAKKKKKGKAKIEHSNTAPPEFRRAVAKTAATSHSSVNLMKILDEIDDRFLKASECAQEVSKMLEATRLHYHSNFADNRGIEVLSYSL